LIVMAQASYAPLPTSKDSSTNGGIKPTLNYFYIGILWFLLQIVAFYFLLVTPGLAPNPCLSDGVDTCYCERIHSGLVKQPSNTYSALAYTLWAFLILISLNTPQTPINRMTSNAFYPVAYGFLAIFLGPGSMAFHGSMTWLGGLFDTLSMYTWLSYIPAYNVLRLTNISLGWGVLIYVALVAFLEFCEQVLGISDYVFAGLVVLAVVSEIIVFIYSKYQKWFIYKWIVYVILFFLAGFAVWFFSRTGEPLCFPDAIIQGHALWHVLTSFAVPCIYVGLKLEPDSTNEKKLTVV